MADKKLSDEVKLFIVQALACYDTPSTVAESVKAEFGITVSRQAIEGYNPTKYAGRALSEKWRVQFTAARESFKTAKADIPIANRAYRLRTLQRMADKAEAMRNLPLVAQLMEQAAKECGDAFTNRQKIDANVKQSAKVVMVPAKDVK